MTKSFYYSVNMKYDKEDAMRPGNRIIFILCLFVVCCHLFAGLAAASDLQVKQKALRFGLTEFPPSKELPVVTDKNSPEDRQLILLCAFAAMLLAIGRTAPRQDII